MDAREALAKALEDAISATDGMSYADAAAAVLPKLVELGFDIIHRDENHGPTLERAAEVADAASAKATNPSRACQADEIATAIRTALETSNG